MPKRKPAPDFTATVTVRTKEEIISYREEATLWPHLRLQLEMLIARIDAELADSVRVNARTPEPSLFAEEAE